MNTLHFIIPGRIVPAVRTTQKQKFVDPRYKKYHQYKQYIGYIASQEIKKNNFVCIEKKPIYFKAITYLATKHRIDVDNILKSLFDGLNKIVWKDDSLVYSAMICKEFIKDKDNEKTLIYIETL